MIEGLQTAPDAPPGARHVAFYGKVHHASLDGAGGIVLANAMLDTGPVPRVVSPPRARRTRSDGAHGIGKLAVAGARDAGEQFVKLARTVPTLARTLWHRLRPSTTEAATAQSAPKGHWFAPRTPLNVAITNQRAFASLSLPLAETRQIAKAHEATMTTSCSRCARVRCAAIWQSRTRCLPSHCSRPCRSACASPATPR